MIVNFKAGEFLAVVYDRKSESREVASKKYRRVLMS